MKVSKLFKKAMIDKNIRGIKQLSEMAGISYDRCFRLMKDQPSTKMVDVIAVADVLGLKLKWVSKQEEV